MTSKYQIAQKYNSLILINKFPLFLKKNSDKPKVFRMLSDNIFAYGKFTRKKEFANYKGPKPGIQV